MKKWTLGMRIAAALAVLGVLTTVGGIIGIFALNSISAKIAILATTDVPATLAANEIQLMATANDGLLYRHIGSSSEADMATFEKTIKENANVFTSDIELLQKALTDKIFQDDLARAADLRKKTATCATRFSSSAEANKTKQPMRWPTLNSRH